MCVQESRNHAKLTILQRLKGGGSVKLLTKVQRIRARNSLYLAPLVRKKIGRPLDLKLFPSFHTGPVN